MKGQGYWAVMLSLFELKEDVLHHQKQTGMRASIWNCTSRQTPVDTFI